MPLRAGGHPHLYLKSSHFSRRRGSGRGRSASPRGCGRQGSPGRAAPRRRLPAPAHSLPPPACALASQRARPIFARGTPGAGLAHPVTAPPGGGSSARSHRVVRRGAFAPAPSPSCPPAGAAGCATAPGAHPGAAPAIPLAGCPCRHSAVSPGRPAAAARAQGCRAGGRAGACDAQGSPSRSLHPARLPGAVRPRRGPMPVRRDRGPHAERPAAAHPPLPSGSIAPAPAAEPLFPAGLRWPAAAAARACCRTPARARFRARGLCRRCAPHGRVSTRPTCQGHCCRRRARRACCTRDMEADL